MDKPHKKAFDHCLHCPHFSDLVENADLSLSDLPDRILEQGKKGFPVKKISSEQYDLAADVATKNFEAVDELAQSMGGLPKDDELLKEILGEDYATQFLSRNKPYEQKSFTEINSARLPGTEGDEAEIDEIIKGILDEENQDVLLDGGLSGELDIGSVNSESTDIDEFLQKYLTDDDSPEITQNEPSEITDSDLSGIIDDSSSETMGDLTGIIDDASSRITDEESSEILDDLSEIMGGESSEIIDDPSEIISDVSSEVLHVGEETNIDELIETILNDDISSENLFEENSLAGVDRTDADISMERAGPETNLRIAAKKPAQSAATQRVTNLSRRNAPSLTQNVVKKAGDYKFPQAAPVNYRVPGIALFILIVVVGLVWYLVSGSAEESPLPAEVEFRETPEIKKESVYYEEPAPVQEQVVLLPEEFPQPFYTEPSLVQPETEVPVVSNTISINTTDSGLYEQKSYPDKGKLTEDMLTVEAENSATKVAHGIVEAESDTSEIEHETVEIENKTAEIESEVAAFTTTDDTPIEVRDEVDKPVESISKVENIFPEQGEDDLSVEPENMVIIDKLEFDIITPDTSDTGEVSEAGDEVNKPAESTSKVETITAEHALADNIQRNFAAAEKGDIFWALNLSSVYQKKLPVNRLLERIRAAGIPAEIKTVFINKNKWYRIRIIGFSSYAEAKDFMQEVTEKTDMEKYWISQVVVDSADL